MASRNHPRPVVPPWALRIRAAREAAGLTQQQLGERVGKDRTYINRLEAGRHRPFTYAAALAQVLGGAPGDYLPQPGEEGYQSDLREEVAELRRIVDELIQRLGGLR